VCGSVWRFARAPIGKFWRSLAVLLFLAQPPSAPPAFAAGLETLLAESAAARTAGDWSTVVDRLEAARALEPGDVDVLVQLAGAYEALQRPDEAASTYQAALDVDPESPDARLGMARIATRNGSYAEAQAIVDEVVDRFPDNADGLLLKGRLRFYSGDLAGAEETLRAAEQVAPDYADVLIALGDVLYAREAYRQSRRVYQRARQLAPGSAAVRARLDRSFAPEDPEPRRIADAEPTESPEAGAEDAAQSALGSDDVPVAEPNDKPDDQTSLVAATEAGPDLLAEATEARSAGDWETVVRKLEEARDLAPENVDILVRLGGAYGAVQRLDEAERTYRAALDLDPESPDAQLGLARLASRRGDYEQASVSVERVLADYPDNVDALLLKGRLSYYDGDLETAEETLRRAAQMSPDYADVLIVLGDVLYVRGAYEEARQTYQAAERIAPDSNLVRSRLARSFRPEAPPVRRAGAEPEVLEPGSNPDDEPVDVEETGEKLRWRVDGAFSYSELTEPRPPWREFSGQITYFGDNDLAYHARVETYERNRRKDTYMQAGIDARLSESLSAYFALGGTPNANFRPRWQVLAGGAARLWQGKDVVGPSLFTLDTKWSVYSGGDVTTITPGIEQYLFSGAVWFNARLSNTRNEQGQWLHGWNVRVNWLPRDDLRVYAGFGEDPETVNNRTFLTQAYSAGGVWALSERTEFRLDFLHEDRLDSYVRNSVTFTVTKKF